MHAESSRADTGAAPRVEQLDALTSLRFFAAFAVVWFHYEPFIKMPAAEIARYGYTGVTFFFVLSGFILAHNYRCADFTDRETCRRYLIARIARIWPLYLFTLLLGVPLFAAYLAAEMHPVLHPVKASAIVLAPLGLQAWVPGSSCVLNCPSWSISVELFFYLTLPFVLGAILRRPVAWMAGVIAAWLGITTVSAVVWGAVGNGVSIVPLQPTAQAEFVAQLIKFFPPARLPEFVLGIALYALWARHRHDVSRTAVVLVLGAAALTMWVLLPIVPTVFANNGVTALLWVPLIWWAAGLRGGVLCHPAMIFLGKISFALYLLHIPFSTLYLPLEDALGLPLVAMPEIRLLLAFGALLWLSAILHTRIEEPCRRPLAAALIRWWGIGNWLRRPAQA